VKSLLQVSVNILPYRARCWIKHMPGFAASQRWVLRHFLEGHPFVHTVNVGPAAGLRFEVTLPHDKAVWTGTYEHEFTRAIIEHVRPGDICFDIGGYRGYISGVMALGGALKVLVFEPLPANQQAVRRLCELNPHLPINLVTVALGAVDETAFLKIMPDSSMGKLAKSSFQADATAVGEIPVMVRRIDSLVQSREIPSPNVVKIDVEGAEVDVVSGALETLRTSRPTVFLEAHSAELEKACSQQFLRLGYKIRRIETDTLGEGSARHLVCLP
jgi:FkbM family methyltransferase